jgi:hypothetical protein
MVLSYVFYMVTLLEILSTLYFIFFKKYLINIKRFNKYLNTLSESLKRIIV